MKNEKLILSVLFLFFFSAFAHAQSLVFEEQTNKVSTIKDQVPAKEALLVFESKFDLEFKSSMEKLRKPLREGDVYKVFVTQKTCVINIIELKTNSEAKIGFGQMTQNSLPPLKAGEIHYFNLKMEDRLEVIDQTNDLKAKSSDSQMLFEKEALIVINSNPSNLELEFNSTVPITEVRKDVNKYLLYIKLQNQAITINHKESGAYQVLNLKGLTVKEMRYFYVILPDYLKSNNKDESYDITVMPGAYMITTDPPGALIQMVGQPDFNDAKHVTPFPYKGARTGKEYITLTLNDYETEQDTIELTNKTRKNKLSKTLVPKFAYIKCNIEPAIPVSKIIMDDKELSPIVNGQPYRCLKGTHNIEISAPHYYSETKPISLAAGTTSELNIKLKPKMGSLSILSGINATGAEVLINGKKAGNIPLSNLALQEGNYNVSFNKSGFISEKPFYSLDVVDNKLTKFEDLKMINTKKIRITTEPESGATVYIDNKKQIDKTNLNVALGIGEHSVKIEMEHYETSEKTFVVDNEHDVFNFKLEELSYKVTFACKPSFSYVIIDGVERGKTPAEINLPLGSHKVTLENPRYLKKTKTISVTEPLSFKTRLFPSSYLVFGGDYGLDQYGASVGYVIKGVLLSFGIRTNMNNNIPMNNISKGNIKVEDINLYDKEDGRIYSTESKSLSFNAKLGFTIKKPFIFLLTAGCSNIQTDKFQKVYYAQHDYIGENYGDIINKGDLFSTPYYFINTYIVFTAGIMVPITNWFYCSADYSSNSDIGPGVSFGLGFMLKKR